MERRGARSNGFGPRARQLAVVVAVLALCAGPLWNNLGRADVDNDEAIYTFAAEEMLRNGDWLTPRSIPSPDAPFLEKPPLKIWLVVGAVRLGLFPHTQAGTRAWDAVFGGVAFVYTAAIAMRLGGPWAGVFAVLLLFVHRPLLFEHGLRSNNMDAALVVAYAAGVYHYLAWRTGLRTNRARAHLLGVTAAFGLAFMTKFVAALFLPAVLAPVTILARDGRVALRRDWLLWLAAAFGLVAVFGPWFVFQWRIHGPELWRVMFGTHVMQRFGAGLDPNHLHPWTYYAGALIREWRWAGTWPIVLAGLAWLGVVAWRDPARRPAALTVLAWALGPTALVSLLSSKLFHYAYPFLPAFAIAGGAAAAAMASAIVRWTRARVAPRPSGAGPVGLLAGSVLALVALVAAGGLPVRAYVETVRMTGTGLGPLQTLRACLAPIARARAGADGRGPGVWGESAGLSHIYFYYLGGLGPWIVRDFPSDPTVFMHLYAPAHYRPVLLSRDRYDTFMAPVRAGDPVLVERAARKSGESVEVMREAPAITPMGYAVFPDVVLMLPGPFSACGVTR